MVLTVTYTYIDTIPCLGCSISDNQHSPEGSLKVQGLSPVPERRGSFQTPPNPNKTV